MKRTLTNCVMAKKYEPEQRNGKCLGVAGNTDEPCLICMGCELCESYETETIRTCYFCQKEIDDITSVSARIVQSDDSEMEIEVCKECIDEVMEDKNNA
jgi:hypothetical protein